MEDELLTKPFSQKDQKKIEALTIQEQTKLMDILNNKESNHEYTDIIKFQLATGMRIGEVLARSKSNIDLKNNTILVDNTLTKDKNDKTILGKHTKTYNKRTGVDNGIRTLNINNELREIIQRQLDKKIANIYNLIFWDYKNNTFISNGEINSWLKRLNDKYKITNKSLSTHVLRHTRITRWKESGVDMKVIQYWAGHVEGSNITNDIYISLTEDFIKQELTKIN
jgi:integrase